MRMPWRKERRPPDDLPDTAAAKRGLERVQAQRPHVHRLLVTLRVERELNNFGTNAEAVFLGRTEK